MSRGPLGARLGCGLIAALSAWIARGSEVEPGQELGRAEVNYALNEDGEPLEGKLSLRVDDAETVALNGEMQLQGSFFLQLETESDQVETTPLNPLLEPAFGEGDLVFPQGPWEIVVTDFNRDGISEFNLGQPGNSMGDHYVFLTFSPESTGRVERVELGPEPAFRYLHPEAGAPSTPVFEATGNGFSFTTTDRGDPRYPQIRNHYEWDPEKRAFVGREEVLGER